MEEQNLQRERELATEQGRKQGLDEERSRENIRANAQANAQANANAHRRMQMQPRQMKMPGRNQRRVGEWV